MTGVVLVKQEGRGHGAGLQVWAGGGEGAGVGGPDPNRESASKGRMEVPRLLSGLSQGCRLIRASWWYPSFFLSGALFF